jgi:hypothetical protein
MTGLATLTSDAEPLMRAARRARRHVLVRWLWFERHRPAEMGMDRGSLLAREPLGVRDCTANR